MENDSSSRSDLETIRVSMSSSDEIGKAEQALESQPIQSVVEIPDGGLQAWLTIVGA